MIVLSSLILFDYIMDTGYKCNNVVGCQKEGDRYEYLLIDSTGLSNPCSKCSLSNEYSCNESSCKEDGYYYIKAPELMTDYEFNKLDRFKTIDMKLISEKCRDICIYYGENCYNINKDVCLIRLVEESYPNAFQKPLKP